MTSPRTRALDAAIELVGTQGLRALTHARVDERAGIPKGSTSNYFRTRRALLSGVLDRLLELEMPEVGAAASYPVSVDDFVNALCALLEYTTGANRTQTTARLVVFMEASHDPVLREKVIRGRVAMEASVVLVLARLGARDPHASAITVMACSEGLILRRIAQHDDIDPRPAFELVVRAALG